nr:hypothetical protein [Edwardsiella piscicida]
MTPVTANALQQIAGKPSAIFNKRPPHPKQNKTGHTLPAHNLGGSLKTASRALPSKILAGQMNLAINTGKAIIL